MQTEPHSSRPARELLTLLRVILTLVCQAGGQAASANLCVKMADVGALTDSHRQRRSADMPVICPADDQRRDGRLVPRSKSPAGRVLRRGSFGENYFNVLDCGILARLFTFNIIDLCRQCYVESRAAKEPSLCAGI